MIRKKLKLKLHLILLLFLSHFSSEIRAESATEFRKETLNLGGPVVLHVFKLDLRDKKYSVEVLLAKDPDGDGPAEGELTLPLKLSRQKGLIAAINTNPFALIKHKGKKPGYAPGNHVDIWGLAMFEGRLRAPADRGLSVWIDKDGTPFIGDWSKAVDPVHGCAGFHWLVKEGKVVAKQKERHPRTAVGYDKEKHTLFLVVVDGRRKGYSQGINLPDLAEYMKKLGCWDAANLDGGGSSIMILRQADGKLKVVNRPSVRKRHRPLAVMLTVNKLKE